MYKGTCDAEHEGRKITEFIFEMFEHIMRLSNEAMDNIIKTSRGLEGETQKAQIKENYRARHCYRDRLCMRFGNDDERV